MILNKYRLGVKLTREQDEAVWEHRANVGRWGKRVEEYWNVHDQGIDHAEAKQILAKTYNISPEDAEDIHIKEGSFVTNDLDLAVDMISIIRMDFVHDFKSGLFFFDLFANHELMMGKLHDIMTKTVEMFERGAELYVQKGLGCFQSSVRPYIYIGEDAVVPMYLKMFRDRFQRM